MGKSNKRLSFGHIVCDYFLQRLCGDDEEEGLLSQVAREELSTTPIQRMIERIVTNGLDYLEENTSPSIYISPHFDRSGILKEIYDTPEQLNNHLEDMESRVRGEGPIYINHNVSNSMFYILCDERNSLVN
jgi:hypothetical protein